VNTREFIKDLAERLDIPQKEAYQLLKDATQVMADAFAEGKTLSIQKLGSFSIKKTQSRKIFSPKLKKHVITPPKKTLEFHPAVPLKEKMKYIRTL
jgi:nucleoid DNA-binding protein